ncbi:hypothetical protein TS85_15885 [Sphingomonas hengshuiensis]|uniref:Uncharacterized protein n=2 Tax=Sphingomonas hengshuiensis TaxID=1609977 RepID=A0A7U4J9Y0_9SPHN|nr:hypothetical protein TS85_15885 [Sphingomonas hengshuiensis]
MCEEMDQVLRRRLAIAQHVYSPAEQVTALGIATEKMIGLTIFAHAGVLAGGNPRLAGMSAAMLRKACDRAEIEAPTLIAQFDDAMLAVLRGATS